MKKAGIIGSGPVGHALANGFLKYGYEVMMGSRDPSKIEDWKQEAGDHARTGTFAETAAFGDVIALAVGGRVAKSALEQAGAENLEGKTILDATNPIAEEGPENGVLRYFTDINHSLMEQLQEAFPNANFVKAFCQIGNVLMVDPQFPGGRPTMFIGGNNEKAKKEATEIIHQFGHDVEDMGGAEAARAIEPLAILWCIPGFLRNEWQHGFRLLKAKVV